MVGILSIAVFTPQFKPDCTTMIQKYVITDNSYPTKLHVFELTRGRRACAVFLHGGTLIGGHAVTDCSRPLIDCCTELQITLYSLGYRLGPASTGQEILDDICEFEKWVRKEKGVKPEDVIVIHASAAALPGFETVGISLHFEETGLRDNRLECGHGRRKLLFLSIQSLIFLSVMRGMTRFDLLQNKTCLS